MGGIPPERLNPIDAILAGLSRPPSAEEMPMEMLCPSGHIVQRHLISIDFASPEDNPALELTIPFYLCIPCTVTYRYQECKLAPGAEG